ncbi:alginate lyase family protein [Mucisphaera calidilacus]|nr:alginate lyase family protein [Mucisphaera calidilacus]
MPRFTPLLVLVAALLHAMLVSPAVMAQDLPQVYITDPARLAAVRERVRAGDPSLQRAMDELILLAEASMDKPMISVVEKPKAPPSGDFNDYVSLSPYWWPDPSKPDGLPYIRRDGEINPERYEYDVDKLGTFGETVRWLGFAYYFTGEERYAREAVKRVRHFLLDPETRMNPRVQYGQFIPGRNEGRKYGIIETLRLRWVPDAISLLAESEAMTEEDLAGARQWFADYARWLDTSEFGVGEREGPNNHGTWCTAQTAYFALAGGDEELVRKMAALIPDRIAAQIEPDGRQPHELARTRAMDYSEFNLRGHTEMAVLAERVGIDLWSFETEDGRSLERAYAFLMPYLSGEKPWPYKQISDPKHDYYAQSLRRMAIATNDPVYEETVASLSDLTGAGRVYLDLIISLPEDFPKP